MAGKGRNKEVIHFTEAPEIQHFTVEKLSKDDNAYGTTWRNLICEYLMTVYPTGNTRAEVVSDGIAYKVLRREKVTAFYDSEGNTLFDVENTRLEKEYKWPTKGGTQEDVEIGEDSETRRTDSVVVKKVKPVKELAEEKLDDEMKAVKDKAFAEPVIGYLKIRCEEDEGLAQDILQDHKTWKKCCDYIYGQARRQTKGNYAAVRDDVVYEWAEDYYHKDDKAEEEKKAKNADEDKAKKAKSAAERKTARAKSSTDKVEKAPAPSKAEAPKEPPKPKKNGKEMDGQLDLFAMIGM